MSTAFTWRHKILDTLSELQEKTYLTGIVEADETFFNVSFKGNHSISRNFTEVIYPAFPWGIYEASEKLHRMERFIIRKSQEN